MARFLQVIILVVLLSITTHAEEKQPLPEPPPRPTPSWNTTSDLTNMTHRLSRHVSVKKGWQFVFRGKGANLSLQSPKKWHLRASSPLHVIDGTANILLRSNGEWNLRVNTPIRIVDGSANFFLKSDRTWHLKVHAPIRPIEGKLDLSIEPKKYHLEVKFPLHIILNHPRT